MTEPHINPKAIQRALLDREVRGFQLDIVAQTLKMERVRRRWWFDESDWSLRRRCERKFLATYSIAIWRYPGGDDLK